MTGGKRAGAGRPSIDPLPRDTRVQLKVPGRLKHYLRRMAEFHGVSVNQYVLNLLNQVLPVKQRTTGRRR